MAAYGREAGSVNVGRYPDIQFNNSYGEAIEALRELAGSNTEVAATIARMGFNLAKFDRKLDETRQQLREMKRMAVQKLGVVKEVTTSQDVVYNPAGEVAIYQAILAALDGKEIDMATVSHT